MLVLEITFLITAIAFGLSVGSFCNNWAYRLCRGESVAKGRSKCRSCEHMLHSIDLVPLFSFLFQKGKCRYCKAKIPSRYFTVELVSGVLYALLWIYLNPLTSSPIEFLRWAILLFFLITLTLQDLETYELSDGINLAGAILFLVLTPFAGDLIDGLVGGISISVPILIISLIADKILKKDTMGGGDIKLMAMLGLHLKFPLTLLSLVLSCFIGIFFALGMPLLKPKTSTLEINKDKEIVDEMETGMIPFGPSICVASFITALFGEELLTMYLSLF